MKTTILIILFMAVVGNIERIEHQQDQQNSR